MDAKKILVVEDNPLNLELATDLLEKAGYTVVAASAAEEAIHIARETVPDLILMDVGLPGMDGLAAAAALKQDPKTRSIPIVALTAHAMKGDEAKALASGCAGYLTKPIDTRTFTKTISNFMTLGSGSRAK